MKNDKKNLNTQRKVLDKRIRNWMLLKNETAPPTGWLKAIREALGLTTEILAKRIGIVPSALASYEKSEANEKVTLETLQKAARAMNCKLIYALIPEEPYTSLESVLDEQSFKAARNIVGKVDHTMRLEAQGLSNEQLREQVTELAHELKENLDSQIWNIDIEASKKKKNK